MCDKSNSKFINISKNSDLLRRLISSSTDHYDKKKGEGGGKSTQILEATKLSCADYNQCGHALSQVLVILRLGFQ